MKSTKEWIRKDLELNWHPYTQMKDCETTPPILIEKAKGIKLFGAGKDWYYDIISSWWCCIHGHNHSVLIKALNNQIKKMDHILFAGFTHKPAIALSSALTRYLPPSLNRFYYSDNGSTAIEIAMKMSYQYWKNKGIKGREQYVSLYHGYHGDTLGTMSLGGVEEYNHVFSGLMLKSFKIPAPYCYRCPAGKKCETCSADCLKPLEDLLSKKAKSIAAMILEPLVMGAGGMIIYPAKYLKKVRELTQKYRVHLIADEVAVGFGRTGKMFACEHAGIEPDFMCLSKGLTSGVMPFAVTVTHKTIYDGFYDDYDKGKTFFHGHTFTANPLGCSLALASLGLFEKNRVLKKVNTLEPYFREQIQSFREYDFIGDARSLGLIGALEIVKDRKTKECFPSEMRIGYRIYQEGLKYHLILRPLGHILYFYPPLCVTKNELMDIFKKTRTILDRFKSLL